MPEPTPCCAVHVRIGVLNRHHRARGVSSSYDNPPLMDEEAAQLWHSCQGDYTNFFKVVFPASGGTGTKGTTGGGGRGKAGSHSNNSKRTSRTTPGQHVAFGRKGVDPAMHKLKEAARIEKVRSSLVVPSLVRPCRANVCHRLGRLVLPFECLPSCCVRLCVRGGGATIV